MTVCNGLSVRLVDCQLLEPENGRECEKVQVYNGTRRMSSFVGVGDTYLLTNAQSIAIQAGVNVQHAIETTAVSFGNLPTCIAGLDIIVGAALEASFCRWLGVDGPDQPEHQQKGDGDEQDKREQGAVG